jgi:Domain of unknown function (DUF4281)
MNAALFSLGSLLVAPLWLLMIILPGWHITARVVRSPWFAVGPAALYAALVVPQIGAVLPAVMSPSLPSIAVLLGQPQGALLAWLHFLAFDAFVGRHVFLDARARGIPIWISSPALFLVLMLGPLGLIAYLVVAHLGWRSAAPAHRL